LSGPDTANPNLALVEDLFFAALDLSASAREDLLSSQPREVREEVLALLMEDQRGSMVQRAVRGVAGSLIETHNAETLAIRPGDRLGAYEIQHELGSGGMGSVYLAVRADDTYHRNVAVKFVRREFDTALFRQRFAQERRILGRLDHPYIARLLDAGSTPTGQPYFVMEFVAGARPITNYAEEMRLTRNARIELFAKVCEAVQYAHQNLTVHRDLKPGNILIDNTGTPKLLDFGIAKLTSTDGCTTDQTIAAGLRMLTPDYASPEHAAGLPVTTSTDVYSLGAILCELLTGERPPRLSEGQQEIDPPRSLGPDLGGILRMAMHRNPGSRYATAAALRDDLIRHLSGKQIRARSYSWPERAMYFGRRYSTFLAASTAVAAGLAIAAVVAVRAANIAEQARQEAVRERNSAEDARIEALVSSEESTRLRRSAEQERNIARDRARETTALTSQLIRDLQDKIEGLPGAGPARLESITIAIQYLERLSGDRDAGPAAQRELALAYMRLADLKGGGGTMNNQGDVRGAQPYLEKAERILRGPAGQSPAAKPLLLRLLARQTEIFDLLGDIASSDRALQEGLRIGRAMPVPLALRSGLTDLLINGSKAANRRQEFDRVFELTRECQLKVPLSPPDWDAGEVLPACLILEARALGGRGELTRAVEQLRRGIEMREAQLARYPANSSARKQTMLAYSHLSAFLGSPSRASLGDMPGALQAMAKVREHAIWNARSDPADMGAQKDLAISSSRYGDLLLGARNYAEAVAQLGDAVDLFQTYLRRLPGDRQVLTELAFAAKRQGDALSQLSKSDSPAAMAAYRKGLSALDELEKQGPQGMSISSYATAIQLRTRLAQMQVVKAPAETEFQIGRALEQARAALAANPQSAKAMSARLRTVLTDAAQIYEALGRTDRASQCRTELASLPLSPALTNAASAGTRR